MAILFSVSHTPSWALYLAYGSLKGQLICEETSHFGEGLAASWLSLFTNSETSISLLFLVILLVFAYSGFFISLTALSFGLSFDYTAPYSFSRGPFSYPSSPIPSLFNGYLFIHPPILYTGIACCCVLFYLYGLRPIKVLYRPISSLSLTRIGLKLIISALLLGALWAQQELNWGGWWSWDLVESGTLVLFCFMLWFLHFYRWSALPHKALSFAFYAFIFFFCGLRYGLFDSVHSFVSTSDLDKNSFNWYYFSPFLFLFLLQLKWYKNLLLQFINLLLYVLALAFIGDFLHKYLGLAWSYPLNRLFCLLTLAVLNVLVTFSKPHFTSGLFSYFLALVPLKWLRWRRGRWTHTLVFILFTGLVLTRGVEFTTILPLEFTEEHWIIHRTFLMAISSWWELFSPSSQTMTYFNFFLTSIYWIYNHQLSELLMPLISSNLIWNDTFNTYTLIIDLNQVTLTLEGSFIFYCFLIKKSRKKQK